MNILFVCRGNIGRSQMAKEFFNASCMPSDSSDSCGTMVGEFEGQYIRDIPDITIEDDMRAMREVGLDIAGNTRKQITPELVAAADKVIVMAEKNTWPEYLKNNSKVTYWDVLNPKDQPFETVCEIRDIVKELVDHLLETQL